MSGIGQQIQDGLNYVGDKIAGNTAETKAEANKQAFKSDQTSIGQKVDAAQGYISNKGDQHKNEASAELNKQKATHS